MDVPGTPSKWHKTRPVLILKCYYYTNLTKIDKQWYITLIDKVKTNCKLILKDYYNDDIINQGLGSRASAATKTQI